MTFPQSYLVLRSEWTDNSYGFLKNTPIFKYLTPWTCRSNLLPVMLDGSSVQSSVEKFIQLGECVDFTKCQ